MMTTIYKNSPLFLNATCYKKPSPAFYRPLYFSSENSSNTTLMSLLDTFHIPHETISAFQKKFPTGSLNYNFAGDNVGPANPNFLKIQALALAIQHDTYQSIGPIYDKMRSDFRKAFTDKDDEPFLVFLAPTGTAANRLGLSPVLKSIDMIIASDVSHLYTREAGGYHSLNNASVYPLKNTKGKITSAQLAAQIEKFKSHRQDYYAGSSKPKVVSITQPTEYGTYYRDDEVKAIAKLCHDNKMLLQMDGSRLFYLPKALNKSLKRLTTDLGVDILFLGGSKNGMAMSEAIVFTKNYFENGKILNLETNPKQLFNHMRSYSKQSGTLVGQYPAAAAQYSLALENDYLINVAYTGVKRAKELERVLLKIPNSRILVPTETNLVLISLPENATKLIEQRYELKIFPGNDPEKPHNRLVRFMTNYSTTPQQIDELKTYLEEKRILRKSLFYLPIEKELKSLALKVKKWGE
ncbi:MAG: beta-eliminating lyase-related protein [Vampirovibrionales bacterium]|nr:beta-eliminating lyase-related protein [Vampirovibrionales bacterium]